jgi:uncharacterized membrane protein HdeD (DUF308 family)
MQPVVDDRSFLRERVRQHWWFFLILGIALLVLGFLAIGASQVLTDFLMYVIGAFLMISGFFHALQAFRGWGWRGAFLHVVAGLLEVLLGFWMLMKPEKAAEFWTIVIAAFLLAGGLARVIMGVIFRQTNWVWTVVSGMLNILVGAFVLAHWPDSGDWFIGLCIAVSIIGNGVSALMFSLALRNLPPDTTTGNL